MSELASTYYQQRAARLGIDGIPDILNGQPVLLLGEGPDQRLSLQRPNPHCLRQVTDRYGSIVHSVDDFVLTAYRRVRPDVPSRVTHERQRANDIHIDTIITSKLYPAYLKAGRITDIQIEAISRSEALQAHIIRARRSLGYLGTDPDGLSAEADDKLSEGAEVYLLTTGALFAGRPLGYAACLTVVGTDLANDWGSYTEVGRDSTSVIAPRYVGISYKKNDALARSALDESRAVRRVIDEWGLANPQTQNVERGKRRH